MRLSVVMPSHNRLHLLKDAIETVRMQSAADWQLVVFDNASDDPIRSHVTSLNDPRIVYDRSDEFLPVTESWNRAIDLADGDYCVLLGDDDGLLPDAIERLAEIETRFGSPEVIYSNIFQFWHEGVAPWRRPAHLVDVKHGFFFVDQDVPFRLSEADMRRAVTGSLALRINFSFNSQAFFYSRAFVAKLAARGPIYRSPFPDYYIANVALALSDSTVIVPNALAFAGVSKSSYGFALYNNLESQGDKLLNIKYERDPVYTEIKSRLLPGPTYNTNFIIAMEHAARDVKDRVGQTADIGRYRKMQMIWVLRALCDGRPGGELWSGMRDLLSAPERRLGAVLRFALRATRHLPLAQAWLNRKLDEYLSLSGFGPMPRYSPDLDCKSAVDVYEAFRAGRVVL